MTRLAHVRLKVGKFWKPVRDQRPHGNAKIVAVAALLVVGLGLYLGFQWLRPRPTPPAGGRDIAENFLNEIRTDKADDAWQSTTAEFKSDLGRENFIRFVLSRPSLMSPVDYVDSQPVKLDHVPRTECTFQTTSPDLPKAKVKVLVAQERGEWRVERLLVE